MRPDEGVPRLFVPKDGGVYTADRAASISGVPFSTVHYWARNGPLRPSVSLDKPKLWSFKDLVGLRVVYWLRRHKTTPTGAKIRKTAMKQVRRALDDLQRLDMGLFDEDRPNLFVTLAGEIVTKIPDMPSADIDGQILPPFVDLIGAFQADAGIKGPDLLRPRPRLRIVPLKLGGAPHIENTRLETLGVFSLRQRGFELDQIASFYPFAPREALDEAIDLERQLNRNLGVAA